MLYDNSSAYGTQIITTDGVEYVYFGHSSRFDTAMEDYNNAINILNSKAQAYLNTNYATDARCVGSVPNNKNSQSDFLYYEWGSSLNDKFRDGDTNYVTDCNRIRDLGINYNFSYWLCSREVEVDITYREFGIRCSYGGNLSSQVLFTTGDDSYSQCWNGQAYLIPIFTLKTNIKVTGGNGTETSPYTLGT